MALESNPEHLDKLKQGVHVWNQWREESKGEFPILGGADFSGANLDGVNLHRAYLVGANLTEANLLGADLRSANLREAVLRKASLYRADFSKANLVRADLGEAYLERASFFNANLYEANLYYTDLDSVDFSLANLENTNFTAATLAYTIFQDVNLISSKGLETCTYRGPCTADNYTFKRSGPLPYRFLVGLGFRDWEIEQSKLFQPGLSNAEINDIIYRIYDLRAHQAVQINPLFISYNHEDGAFVDAVEEKLLEKGVRFWRDIHNMKAGRIDKQVDRAVQLNDIILLVLSEHSVKSPWVEYEVQKAIDIRRKTGKDTLCPVALDDKWNDAHWPGPIVQQVKNYNILDFSQWQDEEVFSRQFSKLIDGLDIYYKRGV